MRGFLTLAAISVMALIVAMLAIGASPPQADMAAQSIENVYMPDLTVPVASTQKETAAHSAIEIVSNDASLVTQTFAMDTALTSQQTAPEPAEVARAGASLTAADLSRRITANMRPRYFLRI